MDLPKENSPALANDRAPRLGDARLFPDLVHRAYLNHAAVAPLSLSVRDAVAGVMEDYRRAPMEALLGWRSRRPRLRAALARLIGASDAEIAFVNGTSHGISAVALCFPWQPSDKVIVFAGDFPANVTPWQRAAETFGLELVFVSYEAFERSWEEGLASVEAELKRGIRLVAVSAVRFQTGLRLPIDSLASLCHSYGAELFVDAVQACGVIPVNVSAGIDYLACGSHKWLMGLEGAGFLYARADRVGVLRPNLASWLSHEDAPSFLMAGPGHLRHDRPIRRNIDFVEAGTMSTVGLAALEASLQDIEALGIPQIRDHVMALIDVLEPRLVEMGFKSMRARFLDGRSGIASFAPPPRIDVCAVHEGLTQLGIGCAIPDGLLRFSPHWYNSEEDIITAANAVDEVLAQLREASRS